MRLWSLSITNSTLSSLSKPITAKLVIHKSKKKVLCAQVDNFFVELLFSFLTIPLGTVRRLTMASSSSDCSAAIHNLCNSISNLGDENYLKSKAIKERLLKPKLASCYLKATDCLPIYRDNTVPGSSLKEKASFIVSDNLQIVLSSSINSLAKFTFRVPVDDIEVLPVSMGEQEV